MAINSDPIPWPKPFLIVSDVLNSLGDTGNIQNSIRIFTYGTMAFMGVAAPQFAPIFNANINNVDGLLDGIGIFQRPKKIAETETDLSKKSWSQLTAAKLVAEAPVILVEVLSLFALLDAIKLIEFGSFALKCGQFAISVTVGIAINGLMAVANFCFIVHDAQRYLKLAQVDITPEQKEILYGAVKRDFVAHVADLGLKLALVAGVASGLGLGVIGVLSGGTAMYSSIRGAQDEAAIKEASKQFKTQLVRV